MVLPLVGRVWSAIAINHLGLRSAVLVVRGHACPRQFGRTANLSTGHVADVAPRLPKREHQHMYEIKTADRPTNHKEFHIVKQAALDRYNRLARHAPHGRLTRGRSVSAREKYAGSYTTIIVNHAVTMAHAFHSDRYASGFALARPTLEALMKQVLLTAYEGDDDGWQKLVAQNTKVNRHSLKDLADRTRWPDLSQWWVLAPVAVDRSALPPRSWRKRRARPRYP